MAMMPPWHCGRASVALHWNLRRATEAMKLYPSEALSVSEKETRNGTFPHLTEREDL